MSLNDSTVSSNRALLGGGVFGYGQTSLNHTTVALNQARMGGGVYNARAPGERGAFTMVLRNSIVAYSQGGNCAGNAIGSTGYNVADDGTCPLTAPGDLPNTNPSLAPLDGSQRWVHPLLPASPAIDRTDGGLCSTQDQRGLPQPQDGDGDGTARCDSGAFELQQREVIAAPCTTKESRKELERHQKEEKRALEERQKAEDRSCSPIPARNSEGGLG